MTNFFVLKYNLFYEYYFPLEINKEFNYNDVSKLLCVLISNVYQMEIELKIPLLLILKDFLYLIGKLPKYKFKYSPSNVLSSHVLVFSSYENLGL